MSNATVTTGVNLTVSSTISTTAQQVRDQTGGASALYISTTTANDVLADSSGNLFKQTSSARFKEDINTFEDDFAKILSLQPVSFRYKESGQSGVGYLAEDVHEKALPSLVSYDAEGRPEAVHYKLLSVYLLEIVKTQQNTLRALREQVDRMAAVVFA